MLLDAKGDANGGKLDAHASPRHLNQTRNPRGCCWKRARIQISKSDDDWRIASMPPVLRSFVPEATPHGEPAVEIQADPNDTQTDGRSLLFAALSDTNILKSLLDAGANPNVEDKSMDRSGNPFGRNEAKSRTLLVGPLSIIRQKLSDCF